MDRKQKQEAVATLKSEIFADSRSVVVAHYKGLTVAQLNDYRAKLREAGASFTVAKNRLAKIAMQDTDFQGLGDMLTGPVGLVYSEDAVAPAKVTYEFGQENEALSIVGGGLGENVLDKAAVEALAKLPSRDELRAGIVRMIQTPATRLAVLTQAPAEKLARVFAAYGKTS